nr:MAG TPA: protein of unknown function DUF2460 [Caudoviricetes sp.]
MALTAKKVYAILKRQISDMEAQLNHPVRYKGTVSTSDLLPLNPAIGDMYNIESKSIYGEAGMNVAWNGVVWDTMGAPIDMSLYLTKEEAETVIQRLVTEYFEKNPVKPGATTEQAQQIEQNKTDIASLKTETGSLKEDLEISLLENDRLYEGTNLAEKFKDEIANYSDIWQWIKARIKAGNFAGIHVNDFIRWQTTDNKWIESRVAGINTYRMYGGRAVPNHIDFISKDLWPALHAMQPVNYNNGVIPIENLSGDGTKTAFVLTNEMAGIASVTIGGTAVTSYTYDIDTHTITFTEAPSTGTNNIVVTGTGSIYPWLSSDLYLYANSLRGHVPSGTSKTSPVKLVDYRNDGIWSKLPDELKAVIVTKHALLPKRYSASGVLSNPNDWGWEDMGKLWIPSEVEVYGCGVWANNAYDKGGFVQYPIFNCNMRRVKGLDDGGNRNSWWLFSASTADTSTFCSVYYSGHVNIQIASNTLVGLPVCFRITA